MARCCYRCRCARGIGIRADRSGGAVYANVKLLTEAYIELTLSSMLNVLAIFAMIDAPDIGTWFSTPSDFISSTIALTIFTALCILPWFLRWLVKKYKERLDTP